MLSKIKSIVWDGNQKWYTIATAVCAVALMMYFGEASTWVIE